MNILNLNTFGGTGNTGTGFSSISSDFAVREGGEAGYIVEGTFTTVTSAGTGVTKGRGMIGINLITE